MKHLTNIYLIGMPGAGKSTLGKALADALGRKFADLDDIIETQMDMSVTDIFRELGESRFRIAEERALESVLKDNNHVIGTGGGTPCFFDNMDKMNRTGVTVFLDPPLEVLVNRIEADLKERPKLAGADALTEILSRTYKERHEFYAKAQVRVRDADPAPQDVIAALERETDS